MTTLLPWAFLFTIPGLVLTALGFGKRPGMASLFGPLAVGVAGLVWLLGDHVAIGFTIPEWFPLLPDPTFSLRVDGLAALMLAVVGLVSFCVYVYSLSYMHGDPGQRRFFCYLDFFVAAMTLLVLGGNLSVLLAGWAGVGLASFLLISFWRDKPHTLRAGLQALGANAVGDATLLLAAALMPFGMGDLLKLGEASSGFPGGATALGWLIVIAASAKSAQGLLYFWLPSAMAGPTPVSALIHAATMVAAGVYLLVRTSGLLALAPAVLHATAWIGAITALLSSFASLSQKNYKRGLAYSTCSQLGYMFAAVGFGAPFAAFFHLVTHASFKALLFLCAGAVIHAAHGEEELAKLSGLRQKLPQIMLLSLIGSLALCGVPVLTSGAFSKDLILEAGREHMPTLGWLLLGSVFLTGLYTGRLWFGVFGSATPQGDGPGAHPVHEPDRLMVWPLVPLAIGALLLGWAGPWMGAVLTPLLGKAPEIHAISTLGWIAGGLGLGGFLVAALWQAKRHGAARLPTFGIPFAEILALPGQAIAALCAVMHSGRLGFYMFTSVLGVGMVLLWSLTRHS